MLNLFGGSPLEALSEFGLAMFGGFALVRRPFLGPGHAWRGSSDGANLRAERERAGLTQKALGHRANFNPTEVNRIERGRRNPGLVTIVKLARALGMPAGKLVKGL